MKKVLFPTDFSPCAHNAFRYTLELAKIINAKVDVISVYPEPLKGKDIYLSPEKQRPIRLEKQAIMEEKMASFIKDYMCERIRKKIVYPSDTPADVIISHSTKDYDLVAMGTKGERNVLNKIMGSVTTKTMKNAACPVLAIPAEAKFKGINQIIYASSLDTNDKHHLQQLSRFTSSVGATIQFLHISDNSEVNTSEDLLAKNKYIEFDQIHVVNNSSVLEGVAEFLDEHNPDVLALFIPKRKLWDSLFHKSFSKKMTFHTSKPLFIFHE